MVIDLIMKPAKVVRLKSKFSKAKEFEIEKHENLKSEKQELKNSKSMKSKVIRSNADEAWKDSLNLYFKDFMELCWQKAYDQIDWSIEPEFLEQELQAIMPKEAMGKRVTDKIVKVWLKNKAPAFIIIHIEIQGKSNNSKYTFTERMLIYRYRIFDRHRVPVASLAILIDDDPNWRPKNYISEMWESSWQFHFPILKILDYVSKKQWLMSHQNPFAIVILAQLGFIETKKDHIKRLDFKTELTRLLFEKGWEGKRILDLYRFLDGILALPKNLEIEYNDRMKKREEEKKVSYLTTAERIGIDKGISIGMDKGINIGMNKGIDKGKSQIVLEQLESKFQRVPEKYLDLIEKAESSKLSSWAIKILNAKVIEEVFTD